MGGAAIIFQGGSFKPGGHLLFQCGNYGKPDSFAKMMRRMWKNWIQYFILPVSLTLGACSVRHSSGHDLDLLTHSPWKYEKAGFDSDDDGVFDALDPRIAGCEKDYRIIFRADGTGTLQEGVIKCRISDPDSLPFIWSFQNNDSTIYFEDQYYRIQALTDNRFEIYADQSLGGSNTRYIIVFSH